MYYTVIENGGICMYTGKDRRLKRIFQNNGKALIVPLDHGVAMGPMEGIEKICETVKRVLSSGADGVILHKGMARFVVDYIPENKVLGIHLNAGTNLGGENGKKSQVCSVKDAMYFGADFVSYHLNLGTDEEMDYFSEIEKIQTKCNTYGLPLLGMLYVDNELDDFSLLHAIRVAEELGFDIVKVWRPKNVDILHRAVEQTHIPILIAGGKVENSEVFVEEAKKINEAGVAGFAVGRNIFSVKNSESIIKSICEIIGGQNRRDSKILQKQADFDVNANKYSQWEVTVNKKYLDQFYEFAEINLNDTVIDIACGSGDFLLNCANRIGASKGIDYSDKLIEIGNAHLRLKGIKNIVLKVENIEKIIFEKKESYDVVICRMALHHFVDCKAAFGNCVKFGKDICTIAMQDIISYDEKEADEYFDSMEKLIDKTHKRIISKSSFENLFIEKGVEIKDSIVLEREIKLSEYILHAHQSGEDKIELDKMVLEGLANSILRKYIYIKENEVVFRRKLLLIKGSYRRK
jgi:DhnA family fructose-bisphosphate aldolase class Ia/ubiquinone/menaquinone biosynthesis C-methylase UbiE